MARNIVKDYIDYDKEYIREYINIITEKKLNSKICDMIIDTYVNIRYFDMYEHIKKNPIDDIEYYVISKFKKYYDDKNREKNVPLIASALIIIRYVFLIEKYAKNKKASKNLEVFEQKLISKYDNTKVIVSNLMKTIKENNVKKERFISKLLSNDFSLIKSETNIKNVYDAFLENSVKIPDLYSDLAINRVYNSGIIYEDRMLVFYTLITREILIDMVNYNYNCNYLVSFPHSLIDKKNKLNNLFKIIDLDYLKERVVLEVLFSDYLDKKDSYDALIHEGYSLAVSLDIEINDKLTLLNIFSYIIVNNENDRKLLYKDFDNIIVL